MQTVSIHITAGKWKVAFFERLAHLMGAHVTIDNTAGNALSRLIEEGEKDFAEGKGITLTQDQLRAMTHGS